MLNEFTDFAMDNFEISKVLDKFNIQYRIIPYEKVDTIDPKIPNWIILFYYPGSNIGHWTCMLFYPRSKRMLFFDPFAFKPDQQWDFIDNKLNFPKPKFLLSKMIIPKLQAQGWKLEVNKYNIQDKFIDRSKNVITENMCGELVVLRIIYRGMSSRDFYEYITKNFSASKIYKIISILNNGYI
jgi:hypothetical protein